jgi:dipeptidyl aminopeptidase/acylaminoacyl peptidase
VLFEGDFSLSSAAWSPDGKMISFLHGAGDHCEIRILNTDGTLRTNIALREQGCGDSLSWTSDQKRLVYTQYSPPDRRPVITAVEIATGEATKLRESGATSSMSWVMDSNTVIVSEMSDPSGPQRHVSFWQVDFEGKATLLRELPFDAPPGSYATPLDRSTAMVVRPPRDFRLVGLDERAANEKVLSTAERGYVYPLLSISKDKQWAAFRINPSGSDPSRMNLIEIARTDGTERRTIELPFLPQVGDTLRILPGGRDLIIVERQGPGVNPGLYRVNVASKSVEKLFDYVQQGRLPEIIASPDGGTLLALITETVTPSASAIDLSSIK